MGRGILLWLPGVPIPIILLLWLFFGRSLRASVCRNSSGADAALGRILRHASRLSRDFQSTRTAQTLPHV
jgi:hypothetical protein